MRFTCSALIAPIFLVLGVISMPSLQEAKVKTEKEPEPAAFWTGLADNDHIDVWRRGLALYLLFDRHIPKDITLGEFARILNKPKWISSEQVFVITRGGVFSLELTPGDTMFLVVAFSSKDIEKHNRESVGLYLNVSGKVTKEDFMAAIAGRGTPDQKAKRIRAWAFSPKWEDYLKRYTAG
jgi:hypothetical protein